LNNLTPKEWAARKSLLSKIPHFHWPAGGYSLLYPDPPWQYRDKADAGERGAGHKYATLSLLELKMMRPEIDRISAPDCALAMWATAPMMREAEALMEAWGFRQSTIALTWIKTYSVAERIRLAAKDLGVTFEALVAALAKQDLTVLKPRKGMGNWTRGNAEFLLWGTRGKVQRANAGVGSVVVAEIREHSRKPDEVRTELVKLLGDVPRLEMFSRASAPGWDSWGLEAGTLDDAAPAPADEELWPLDDGDAPK
jgi:N6-adenosine-specific RNA methylase IME4